VETIAFQFKDKLFPFPPIYLQGLLRAADILILLIFGPWSYEVPAISKAVKESFVVTLFFAVAGLFFLTGWKIVFGSSMLKLDVKTFHHMGSTLIAFYVISCLLSPIAEELFFRGIFYRKMREKWNTWICIGVVSSLFAIPHYYFNGQALLPFSGSLVFCIGYEKTKFILAPILLHISGNLIIYLSPFLRFI